MYQLTIANYLLILIGLVAHYPIGKRLGIKPFFSATLVGVASSALVVAALANIYACFIRPYILLTILVGIGLLVYDLRYAKWKLLDRSRLRDFFKMYLLFAGVGIAMLLVNNPANVFLSSDGVDTYFHFNRHYSYYASQSIEMLNAPYLGRLKVPNFYPLEWTRYHFFNSGTQAVVQGLISQPSLFTFFITQIIIIIFILLAFAEHFLLLYGWTKKNLLLLGAWFAIGFTLFSFSLKWSLITTSPFSVFAAVLTVISILRKDYKAAVIFSFVLGASAFRMMPIALALIAFFCIMYLLRTRAKFKTLVADGRRIHWLGFFGLGFFAIYNYLTIFAAPTNSQTAVAINSSIFSDQWSYMIVSYKFLGYLYNLFEKPAFINFNLYGFFDNIVSFPILRWLLVAVVVVGGLLAILEVIYSGKSKSKLIVFTSALTISLFAYYYFVPLPASPLYLIALPYFLLMAILAFRPTENFLFVDKCIFYGFIIVSFVSVLVLQYTSLDSGIKVPPMYVMFDAVLWTIIGAYIFTSAKNNKYFYVHIGLTIALLVLFKFDIVSTTRITDLDDNYIRVPVTEFIRSDFKRSNYVDENNMMKVPLSHPDITDAYSSILGANVNFASENAMFMNYRFTNIPPASQ